MRRAEPGRALGPSILWLSSCWWTVAGWSSSASGQMPPVPAPTQPADRAAELEQRLLRMEETNRRLAEQVDVLVREVQDLRLQVRDGSAEGGIAAPASVSGATARAPGSGPTDGPGPTSSGPNSPVPSYTLSATKLPAEVSLDAVFGPGFQLESEDEEFQLQFHQETQLDYREFDPNGEVYARSGFYTPRVRAFFTGHLTKPVEYMFSINRGFGNLDLLDGWFNYHPDDRFQFKLGRFMTPFNYEQFAIQNMWLIAPERSLFTGNLGMNRQLGAMFWGVGMDERLDYAVAFLDGPRNSFEDFNDAKDVGAYLNARPFQSREKGSLLRNLNLGGSFAYGAQDNPLIPIAFRTAANASNAGTADRASPPFLVFEEGVHERGQRTFWSGHMAYFYRSLSIFADYNGGILRLVPSRNALESVVVPVSGYSVAAGYFLTGETLERRTIVEPKRPFSLKRGEFAPGAVEVIGRYSEMDVDPVVFASGLSNPDRWSNRAWITTLGINWYPNRFVKIYLDWQHSEFGNPIFYAAPNRKQLTNEMLWLRFQLYF